MSRRPTDALHSRIDRLREEARERVERTSLIHVAHAGDMGPDTLRRFLAGATIPPRPLSKLERWLSETRRLADERAARCVGMVLEVVADLPDRRKMKAVRAVLDTLRAQFKQGVGAPPLWLQLVIETLDVKEDDEEASRGRVGAPAGCGAESVV